MPELGHWFFLPALGFQNGTYTIVSPGSPACLSTDLRTSQSPSSLEPISYNKSFYIYIFLDLSP